MLTEKDKIELINIIKKIDVKQMSIDHEDANKQKWFRFGNYNALQIVTEIIKQLPVKAKSEKVLVS